MAARGKHSDLRLHLWPQCQIFLTRFDLFVCILFLMEMLNVWIPVKTENKY